MLAAAIQAGAQAVVTFNLDDFPASRLEPYNIEAKHPDDFVVDTIDLSPGVVTPVVAEQAAALKNPPRSVAELLDPLRDQASSDPPRTCGNCSTAAKGPESSPRGPSGHCAPRS